MRRLRKSKSFKTFTVFVALNMLFQLGFPTVSFALTSGPAQEEFASFEPASTTDMVDLYSGDFTYNIPLLSVPGPNGGYPINLSYHSGVGMEQEASWVGLGWNVNVGAINRQLRGLPDDFNGDQISYEYDFKDNVTVGLTGPSISKEEQFGLNASTSTGATSFDWQVYYNNYRGMGYRLMVDFSLETESKFGLGLGLTLDSQNGLGIEPSISMGSQMSGVSSQNKLSANINNRQGLTDVGFASSISAKTNRGINPKTGKQRKGPKGFGSSSSLSFATNHSVPQVTLPFSTTTVPFDISIGDAGNSPSMFGEYSSGTPWYYRGYVNTTTLVDGGTLSASAYGYLNTQNALPHHVKDFSRNTIEYSKKVPNLSSSNYTYDLFTYTGQGAGGMFRPYRSTVDVLTDQLRVNQSSTTQVNLEFGINSPNPPATDLHVGFGFPSESSESQSGMWSDGNHISIGLPSSNDAYEYAYFQEYGEKTGFEYQNTQEDQLYNWDGDQAVRLDIKKTGGWANRNFEVSNDYRQHGSAGNISINNDEYSKKSNNTREKRGKVINKLTAKQASKYGFSRGLMYYDNSGNPVSKTFPNNYHISEIEVIEPDGMRYYYGLPAYNNEQIDETMATGATSTDGTTPVASNTNSSQGWNTSYTPKNEYRSRTTLPAYVHSWMLTAVVSADYVDVTGNGPSEDDLGYYTKFNYQKKYDNYEWRLPYIDGSFIEGTESDEDNMVAYTYGKKEVFFLKSIETKTHIAIFEFTDRQDGLSAGGQYATGAGSQPMQKLDKIKLFSKNEYQNGASAIPIKTINFEYDYSLCPGIPNSSTGLGKLTLKKLYFTYENSNRGQLSPYQFHYDNSNYGYNRMYMDRWGNYKDISSYQANYSAELFPYNDQDVADAAPWDLTSIDLPTGGTMQIDYEEDDYAYVEGEKPMKMFDVVGVNKSSVPTSVSDRYNSQTSENFDGYKVYFALEEPINASSLTTSPSAYIQEKYFNNSSLKKVWFKVLIDIKSGNKDYVTGYANVDYANSSNFGLEKIANPTGSNYDVGYFLVESEQLSFTGGTVHPFRKAAFQHLQLIRPELIYGSGPTTGNPLSLIGSLLSDVLTNLTDLTSAITGFNNFAYLAQYGETVYFGGESIVKLYDEDQLKKGGGSRVKQLTIDDNWDNNEDGTPENALYGQVYEYKLADGKMSSGVAYEPRIGGEESVLRKPVNYSESTFLASTRNLFVEQPILENYYPGPSVGYSRVTVKSIAPSLALADNGNNSLLVTSAPITEYEFYTPKDFPIWTDETDMSNDPDILRPLMVPGVYTDFTKKRARSQGYSIVLNDMAGKPKATTQRTRPNPNNPTGTLISKEEYIYQTQSPYDANQPNYLKNQVKTLNSDGTYTDAIIGQSHDIFIDMNENKMTSSSKNIDFNIDMEYAPPTLLLFSIVPLPYWGDVELSTKTAVTNKIIYRTGILKEVITTTDESVIKQANLAYDINTGSPLLTQVTNEYKDPIYTHDIPAHWYYAGMEGAYQNIDYTESYASTRTTSTAVGPNGPGYLLVDNVNLYHVGDEVGIEPTNERVYVVEVNSVSGHVRLRRQCDYLDGVNIDNIKIVRSGHRNMLTANVGNVVSKAWNFNSSTAPPASLADLYVDASNNSQVIDANAIEFKDQWQYNPHCEKCPQDENPYTNGYLGNWRVHKTHKYVEDRVYSGTNTNQTDGVYASFNQFDWFAPGANPAWILANEVTRYSPHGYEVENKDALGNYSSARYAYDNTLNVAVAYNARQMEIATNGFEDHTPSPCVNPNAFFNNAPWQNLEAHSGNNAVVLQNGNSTSHIAGVTSISSIPIVPTETIDLEFIKGKKYVVSAWVKQKSTIIGEQYETYTWPRITATAGVNVKNFIPEGNIIEGWQRIEGEFVVPTSASSVDISLEHIGVSGEVFFDDVRVYPSDANMKTFVYDDVSLKLAAELDENNYATFYVYDEQGALSKIKRETEDGIKTISEGRTSNVKQ